VWCVQALYHLLVNTDTANQCEVLGGGGGAPLGAEAAIAYAQMLKSPKQYQGHCAELSCVPRVVIALKLVLCCPLGSSCPLRPSREASQARHPSAASPRAPVWVTSFKHVLNILFLGTELSTRRRSQRRLLRRWRFVSSRSYPHWPTQPTNERAPHIRRGLKKHPFAHFPNNFAIRS
jgi:hypothetical protein